MTRILGFPTASWFFFNLAAGSHQHVLAHEHPHPSPSKSHPEPGYASQSSSSNISLSLPPHLSSTAVIHTPLSPTWSNVTARWQAWDQPSFAAIVDVTCESDVEATIHWANSHGKQFSAISGGHGGTAALATLDGAVGIRMRGLKDVKVAGDGRTARVGGGILSGELLHALWAEGKQAVVGACECTGAVAPLLGGGHGWLQGRYGLSADNLVSARLTLANGTSITVSKTSHKELFWAVRGAGHNFGIVTSLTIKVYDHTPENEMWSYEVLAYKGDKVEEVYELADKLLIGDGKKERDVKMVHLSYFMRNAEIDPVNPIILFYLLHQSSTGIPKTYSTPFHRASLAPIPISSGAVTLPNLAPIAFFDMASPFCAKGSNTTATQRWPANLPRYNIRAMRAVYDALAALPAPFNGSAAIFEGYSTNAVDAVPASGSAYADRESKLLVSPFIIYPAGNREWDAQGLEYGRQIRDLMVEASGRPLSAYVNYASGYEDQAALYGYEGWRREKLGRLKREYDPLGRLRGYVPVEV